MTSHPELGSLRHRDPRDVWRDEAADFTPWLRDNIALLASAVGLELDVEVQREVAVGLFSADLLGTDVATQARVLVENQLEQTDHRHLGQLLTYAGGLDTGVLIWVASKIREEHRQALAWLNQQTVEDVLFFGVEVQVLQIDDSRLAPHFDVVVAPNEWQKSGTRGRTSTSGRSAEREERYREFWRGLLEELLARDPTCTTATPERVPKANWFGIGIGRSYFQDNMAFGWEEGPVVRVELYIDSGDKGLNEGFFQLLHGQRAAIEKEFGEPLLWTPREDIRACRIYVKRAGDIQGSPEALTELKAWGAERMLRIRSVFGPRVRTLDPTRLEVPIDQPGP
jgi:hypothetical protein